MNYSAQQIAKHLGGILKGKNITINFLCSYQNPRNGAVVVISKAKHLSKIKCRDLQILLVVPENLQLEANSTFICVPDPRLALAKLTALFNEPSLPMSVSVSSFADIHHTAQLAKNVNIAAGVVIAEHVKIGRNTIIKENCVIGSEVSIGENCFLYPNVTLYQGVTLGHEVILHSGTVIGADGFGYVKNEINHKIYQLGTVVIEDEVEIGANTCVDRATLDETRIGKGTKIDNLCQIGHNTIIGKYCLIAAQTGIAGSVKLGDKVIIGGGVGIREHVHIGDEAKIAAKSAVLRNVPAKQYWAGIPAQIAKGAMREHYLISKLEDIWQFIKEQRK